MVSEASDEENATLVHCAGLTSARSSRHPFLLPGKRDLLILIDDLARRAIREYATMAQQQGAIAQPVYRREIMRDEDDSAPTFAKLGNTVEALRLKAASPTARNLVEQQDVGVQVGGNRKSQPHKHAR